MWKQKANGINILNSVGECHVVLRRALLIYIPTTVHENAQFPTSSLILIPLIILIFVNMIGQKRYLTMVLICLFILPMKLKIISFCISPICCLFITLAHLLYSIINVIYDLEKFLIQFISVCHLFLILLMVSFKSQIVNSSFPRVCYCVWHQRSRYRYYFQM